jgi:hypothetical protein
MDAGHTTVSATAPNTTPPLKIYCEKSTRLEKNPGIGYLIKYDRHTLQDQPVSASRHTKKA